LGVDLKKKQWWSGRGKGVFKKGDHHHHAQSADELNGNYGVWAGTRNLGGRGGKGLANRKEAFSRAYWSWKMEPLSGTFK